MVLEDAATGAHFDVAERGFEEHFAAAYVTSTSGCSQGTRTMATTTMMNPLSKPSDVFT